MRLASRKILRENSLMVTTPENLCIGERTRAGTPDHEGFLDRHRPVLLRYLDGTAPTSKEEPDALGYVESVLTEWHELFDGSKIGNPTAEERTFWYALYQLEELAELPSPHSDPYEELLMENLVEVRELLRNRQSLPEHRFMATRPDGI
jgi:hypothetical protein